MRSFPLNPAAVAALLFCSLARAQSGAPAPDEAGKQASASASVQKVTVTGQGDKLGTGLILDEDAPKARSSVTKAELEKTRSSGNPFQALDLLPGVNASSFDATGLFGGNLRVRGFNSDQMGFTVNGAPVNDSGNFAVYPQEYVDSENVCSLYVTQGAPDVDAPHVGASGGNVGITTCGPEDRHRVRLAISGGQLGFARQFVRVDTGLVGRFKGFASVSQSHVRKWKGPGVANRDHVDAGASYDLGGGNVVTASMLFNRELNNNFLALTPAQFAQYGYDKDYSPTVPVHQAPAAGTAQNDGSIASPKLPATAYAGYSLNPFENFLASAKASFTLADNLHVDVLPYFWYGYGTGGTQQASLQEGTGGNQLHGGIGDLNGDGDTLDKVMVYRGSVTRTDRPGVSAELSWSLDRQDIVGGLWFERARHRQTQPATTVDDNGNIGDPWLRHGQLPYADGTTYQGRDWLTVSTAASVFAQDTVSLMDGKLKLTPALSVRRIQRDFTNYANSGSGGGVDYQVREGYTRPLPALSASLQATRRLQVFASISKEFRVPNNSEYGGLAQGVSFANGVGSSTGIGTSAVRPEVSINMDLGTRYHGELFTGAVTGFVNKFRDRIASSFDPAANISHDWNVGRSTTEGAEIEAGTVPMHGWSGYASFTYTRSTMDDDMPASATTTYATSGKQFPDTPKGMASLSVQYAQGPVLVNVAGKYTGRRYLTLVDDEAIAGVTSWDLNAAYKLPKLGKSKVMLYSKVSDAAQLAALRTISAAFRKIVLAA